MEMEVDTLFVNKKARFCGMGSGCSEWRRAGSSSGSCSRCFSEREHLVAALGNSCRVGVPLARKSILQCSNFVVAFILRVIGLCHTCRQDCTQGLEQPDDKAVFILRAATSYSTERWCSRGHDQTSSRQPQTHTHTHTPCGTRQDSCNPKSSHACANLFVRGPSVVCYCFELSAILWDKF